MSMTKIDTIESAYEQLDLPKKDCIAIVDGLFEIMKDTLSKGDDIMISGFGKWTVKAKKKRKGRNPKTGKEMIIHARKVVTFKSSSVLRDMINSGD
ncbi:MAG: integration host factor subunit alpha [Deltaproteobacteria bacterium]|nr:integration host factor subunit alpha [Deltaproteobacteria bacterium]